MKSFKLLLKHNLSNFAVCSFNGVEFFITLDFIRVLDGHFAASLDALDIATVGGLKIWLGDQVVNVDELKLIVLRGCR